MEGKKIETILKSWFFELVSQHAGEVEESYYFIFWYKNATL